MIANFTTGLKNSIKSNSGNPLRQPWYFWLALLPLILVVLPLIYIFYRASLLGLDAVIDEIFRSRNLELLTNTLTLAIGVTLLSMVFGLFVAWAVERTNLPGRKFWRIGAGLPLVVPAFVASYAWASISVNFQNMAGAILVLALAKFPLVYLPVAAALRNTDPAFEDVSRSLGQGPWRTFYSALLPQLLPALGGGAILVATHMFAEFGALALLGVQTFTTAIFESYELQFNSSAAAMQSLVLLIMCLPVIWLEMRIRVATKQAVKPSVAIVVRIAIELILLVS